MLHKGIGSHNTTTRLSSHFQRERTLFYLVCVLTKGSTLVIPASGVPTVTITSNITQGIVPLTVVFTATTSGTVENWLWNFGDCAVSPNNCIAMTGSVVTHTYTSVGTFEVGLVVGNEAGSYQTKYHQITVLSSPPVRNTYLPIIEKQ